MESQGGERRFAGTKLGTRTEAAIGFRHRSLPQLQTFSPGEDQRGLFIYIAHRLMPVWMVILKQRLKHGGQRPVENTEPHAGIVALDSMPVPVAPRCENNIARRHVDAHAIDHRVAAAAFEDHPQRMR